MRLEGKQVTIQLPDGNGGLVEKTYEMKIPRREKDKVYIVGCAGNKESVPFGDVDAEYWGVNNLYGVPLPGAKWDRWFEIHNIWYEPSLGKLVRRDDKDFRGQPVDEYMKGLASIGCPVYMQQFWPELIPLSTPYPIGEVLKFFAEPNERKQWTLDLQTCRYLTNSITYQIVLAIVEGFKRIEVWAVDMAVGCLSPDTRVLTPNLEWVKSSSLSEGDELMAFDEEPYNGNGKTRRWRKTKVTKCPEIMRPCYKVYLDDGTEFIASEKHGWLTHGENVNRWKRTEELITKHHREDRPSKILKLSDVWEHDKSWESGYLAAAFDGEGYLSQFPRKDHVGSHAMSLGFAQKDNAMQDTTLNILKKYGFEVGVSEPNHGETKQFYIKGGKPEVMRFLGTFRPQRLLEKFNGEVVGEMQRIKDVAVIGVEHIGMQPVIGLETEAKTYVAEGFASHNSEYQNQRPSCEFWLGIAAGMGIEVYIPPENDLLKTRFMYGLEEKKQDAFKKKVKKLRVDLSSKMGQAQKQLSEAQKAVDQYVGAIHSLSEIDKIWSNFDDKLVISS